MKNLWLCKDDFNNKELCPFVLLNLELDELVCEKCEEEKLCENQVFWLPQEGFIGVWSEIRSIRGGVG